MDSPLTSSLMFFDMHDNRIACPPEWTRARIEIAVDPQVWAMGALRLVRQGIEELPLYSQHSGGKLHILADWPLSGTGHYRLTLCENERVVHEKAITIAPRKISEAAYTQMLEDLEMRLPAIIALGLQRNGALAGLKMMEPGESTIAMELARLRQAINGSTELMGLAQILHELAINPYQVLQTTKMWVPRERARRPHPSDLVQAMARPSNLDTRGIPERLLDTRVEQSVDVYENRLVKVFLHLVERRLHRLQRFVERISNHPLTEEVAMLRASLNAARRKASFIEAVTLPAYLPLKTTMVLLKQPAYRAALQGYLEFQRSPGIYLNELAMEAPLENLPFLYQVWSTLEVFAVLLAISGELGYEVQSQQLAKRDASGIFIQLVPDGKPVLTLHHPTAGTTVRIIPERTYASNADRNGFHSISFAQRPDLALEIFRMSGTPAIYLFDPKYKLDSEWQEVGSNNGTPKKEDIDKMHTYRDAIRVAQHLHPVQYAAILYPGPSNHYGQDVGALQALPGSAVTLEEQLRKILTDALKL